jgi:hypothetical protein
MWFVRDKSRQKAASFNHAQAEHMRHMMRSNRDLHARCNIANQPGKTPSICFDGARRGLSQKM